MLDNKFSTLGYSQAAAKEAFGFLCAAYNMYNYSATFDKCLLDPGTGWAQVSGYHCADWRLFPWQLQTDER